MADETPDPVVDTPEPIVDKPVDSGESVQPEASAQDSALLAKIQELEKKNSILETDRNKGIEKRDQAKKAEREAAEANKEWTKVAELAKERIAELETSLAESKPKAEQVEQLQKELELRVEQDKVQVAKTLESMDEKTRDKIKSMPGFETYTPAQQLEQIGHWAGANVVSQSPGGAGTGGSSGSAADLEAVINKGSNKTSLADFFKAAGVQT